MTVIKKKQTKLILFYTLVIPITGILFFTKNSLGINIYYFIQRHPLPNYVYISCFIIYVLSVFLSIIYGSSLCETLENKKINKNKLSSIFIKYGYLLSVGCLFILISFLLILIVIILCKILLSDERGLAISLKANYFIEIIIVSLYQILSIPIQMSFYCYLYLKKNKSHLIIHSLPKNWQSFSMHQIGIIILCFLFLFDISLWIIHILDTLKVLEGNTLVLVTAHRGDSENNLENSLSAFAAAIQEKSDFIELDVHETKDGYLVISHDDNLKRLSHKNIIIGKTNYEDLKNIDLGKGIKITTLDEVLKLCKDKVKVNIELKITKYDKDFVSKVIEVVKDHDMVKDVILASSDLNTLKKIKKIDSNLITVYILDKVNILEDKEDVDIYSVEQSYVNDLLVEQVHQLKKKIFVWTVDSEYATQEFSKMNVDSIITNNPTYIKEVLRSNGLVKDYPLISRFFKVSVVN